jgi:tetratricopeptide (TPR) repeat protein
LAENLSDLAMIKRRLGEIGQALEFYAAAIEGLRQARGNHHPFLAVTLGNYGKTLGQANRLTEAEAALREALAIQQSAHGAVHPSVAFVQFDLGNVLFSQGRLDDAVSGYTQALQALPRSHEWWRPRMLVRLAAAELARGRLNEAKSLYRQALQALQKASRNPKEINQVRLRLAEVSMQLHELENAEIELREVLKDVARDGAGGPTLQAEALKLLGSVLIDRGNADAAIPLLEQSLQLLQALPEAGDDAIEPVRALLARARNPR